MHMKPVHGAAMLGVPNQVYHYGSKPRCNRCQRQALQQIMVTSFTLSSLKRPGADDVEVGRRRVQQFQSSISCRNEAAR